MDEPILIDLPEETSSERIVIRCYRPGDGFGMFEAVDESREHILPWMPWGSMHRTVNDSERYIRGARARWLLREDLPMGIYEKSTGRFLGGTGLHRIDWEMRAFEIGYWIRKSDEGKGYVTESVRLLTSYAFERLKANRVFIRCSTRNHRSEAVARRAGFVYEGTLRNSILDADGKLHDTVMFSLIPSEWAVLGARAPCQR